MPGDERKFKRRSIVAFIPTCNRERDIAVSHTSALEGVPVIGVAVASIAGVPVDVGANVGGGRAVAVGEGSENGVGVTVPDGVSVAVGDGGGRDVAVNTLDVLVDDGGGSSVGGALVEVSFAVGVAVRRNGVLVGVSGCGALAGIHNTRQTNINKRMTATTSLKRS